jgi:hypothetical protein
MRKEIDILVSGNQKLKSCGCSVDLECFCLTDEDIKMVSTPIEVSNEYNVSDQTIQDAVDCDGRTLPFGFEWVVVKTIGGYLAVTTSPIEGTENNDKFFYGRKPHNIVSRHGNDRAAAEKSRQLLIPVMDVHNR